MGIYWELKFYEEIIGINNWEIWFNIYKKYYLGSVIFLAPYTHYYL